MSSFMSEIESSLEVVVVVGDGSGEAEDDSPLAFRSVIVCNNCCYQEERTL